MDTIFDLIKKEELRQEETVTLIPSENYVSAEVRRALSSKLVNKYSEGYPGRRYYQGNGIIDEVEILAIERAKNLFGVPHVNVQPYSGSPANSAVYFGLLNYGDTIMGLTLSSGGHLTHGHPNITLSGKYFKSVQYGLNVDGVIDYDSLAKKVLEVKPSMIIAGITAYSKFLDFERFSQIADSVSAILLSDISHIAGLVAANEHPSPVKFSHVITTTTHKTLRGPRGAMIMVTDKGLAKDVDMGKKIDRAVFPGLQGGPHDNQTAAIAVALAEAMTPDFKTYAKKVIQNAKVLADELKSYGFTIVSGGTDNHMFLLDLRPKNILGKDAAIKLEEAGIVTNYNTIPNDPNTPANPSGLRLGTPAVTTRGMGEKEMKLIARWINSVLVGEKEAAEIKKEVLSLSSEFKTP